MKKLLRVYSRQSRLKPGAVLCCASPYVVAQRRGHNREHCYPELKKTHRLSPSVPWHLFCSAKSAVTPVTLELMRFRWRSRGVRCCCGLGCGTSISQSNSSCGTTDHRSYQLQDISSNPSVSLEQVFNLTVGRILRSRDSSEAKSYLHTKASVENLVLSIT